MVLQDAEDEWRTENVWIKRFLVLFFIGFFIILVGVIIVVVAALLFGEGTGGVGGFIWIGPIPILFGAGPEAPWLAFFAIILGILCIALLFILRRKSSGRV
jgi:uncharacterized membrane protein